MNILGAVLIAGALFALLFVKRLAPCVSPSKLANFKLFLPLVKEHASKNGIDWRLVAAHITVESSWNVNAVNVEDDEAIGLGQILCKRDGGGGCNNHFDIAIWPTINRYMLFDPTANIETTCQIIAANQEKYGLVRGIAVYNRWASHTGVISNVVYTERVLCVLRKLQGEFPNG